VSLFLRVLVVAGGGSVGCALRYLATLGAARVGGTDFPWGTLAVNVVGCLLAGLLFGLMEDRAAFSPTVRLLLMTGFLGGFTTFSAYSLEAANLLRDGTMLLALLSLAANNVIGIACAFGGFYLGRAV
jgi:CrcB protein